MLHSFLWICASVTANSLPCDTMSVMHCSATNMCSFPSFSDIRPPMDASYLSHIASRYRMEHCCDGNEGDSERAFRDLCHPFEEGNDGVMYTRTNDFLIPPNVWLWEARVNAGEKLGMEKSEASGNDFLTMRRPDFCDDLDTEHERVLSLPVGSAERKEKLCSQDPDKAAQWCDAINVQGFSYPGYVTYPPRWSVGVGARREKDGTTTTVFAQPTPDKKSVTIEFDITLASDRYQQLYEIVFSLDEDLYGMKNSFEKQKFKTMHNRVENDYSGPERKIIGIQRSMAISNYTFETGLGNYKKRKKTPSMTLWFRANQPTPGVYGKELTTIRLQVNDNLLAPTQIYHTDGNGFHWKETTEAEYLALHPGTDVETQIQDLLTQRLRQYGECIPSPDPFVEALNSGKRDFTVEELKQAYMMNIGQTYASYGNIFRVPKEDGTFKYFYSPLRSAPPYTQSPGNMGTVMQLAGSGAPATVCSATTCDYHVKLEVDYATVMNGYGMGSTRLSVGDKPICNGRIGVCEQGSDCDTNRQFATYMQPGGGRLWSPWPVGHNITMIDGETTIVQKDMIEIPKDGCALPISTLFQHGPKAIFMNPQGKSSPVSIFNLTSHAHSNPLQIPFEFPTDATTTYSFHWDGVTYFNSRTMQDGSKVFDPPLVSGERLKSTHLNKIHAYGEEAGLAAQLPNNDPAQWISNQGAYNTFEKLYKYVWTQDGVDFYNAKTVDNTISGQKIFDTPLVAGQVLTSKHLDKINQFGEDNGKTTELANTNTDDWILKKMGDYRVFAKTYGHVWNDVTFWNQATVDATATGAKVFDPPLTAGTILTSEQLNKIHKFGEDNSKSWALPNADADAWIAMNMENYATFAKQYDYAWKSVTFWNQATVDATTTGSKVFEPALSPGEILLSLHLDKIQKFGDDNSKSWALPNADPLKWIEAQSSYETFDKIAF